jgi:hypothetical protein
VLAHNLDAKGLVGSDREIVVAEDLHLVHASLDLSGDIVVSD